MSLSHASETEGRAQEDASARVDRRPDPWLWVTMAVLLAVNLLPLTARYLPFTDLQGHIGLVGALARLDDPAARIRELYVLHPRGWLLPSALFEHLGEYAARLIPATAYANLYLALASVVGLPLALAYLLRAYRRDARLALLMVPLVYYRCVWFGFVDFLASVPLALLGLGLLRRTLDAPSTTWGRLIGLALLGLLVTEAHFFGAGVFFLLCAVVLATERPPWKLVGAVALALAPGVLFLGQWLLGMRARVGAPSSGFGKALLGADRNPLHLARRFYEWTIHGIQTPLSHVVMAALALSLVAVAVWSLRRRGPVGDAEGVRARRQPLWLFLATAALFVVLPFSLPIWWCVNARLVPLVVAFALLALPTGEASRRMDGRGRVPAWLLLPAVAGGLVWGGYLARDFHAYFNGVEMHGFTEAIDDIPPGQNVLMLWPEFTAEPHYAHFPMAALGGHYVARRGGFASPALDGEGENQPIVERHVPRRSDEPSWGRAALFRWVPHAARWDWFVVKQPVGGSLPRHPFAKAPPGAISHVSTHGLWEVWKKR